MMMRLLTLLAVLALAVATPPATKSPSFFGVSKLALQTRGGDVHELTTLEDVNSIILTAGSNNQLVVIDFSECMMVDTGSTKISLV
jgi:hypothetical protein